MGREPHPGGRHCAGGGARRIELRAARSAGAGLPIEPAQIARHIAETPEHRSAVVGMIGADERHRTGMAEYLPHALGAGDRRGGVGAVRWFAGDQPVIIHVERHGNEMNGFSHGPRSSRYARTPRFLLN